MRRKRGIVESASDWFGREVDTGDFFCDDAEGLRAAEWDFNDGAGSKP